jgi:uncharacterized protein (TIGR02246 family)
MKRIFLISTALLLVVTFGCAPQVDMQAERAAIHAFHDECLAAMLVGDLDCFAEDGQALPHGASVIKGRSAIGELISQMIEDPNLSVSHDIVNIEVSRGGDLAYIHYTYELTMSDQDGSPATEYGKGIFTLKKQPQEGWKILIDIWNANNDSLSDSNDLERDLEAIAALREKNLAAINASDVSTLLTTFTDDVVWLPDDQPPVVGMAALEAWATPIYEQFDFVDAEGTVKEVVVVGDWAFEWGLITGTMRLLEGGEDMQADLKYIYIYGRQPDGSWLCAYDIVNKNVPSSVYPVAKKD